MTKCPNLIQMNSSYSGKTTTQISTMIPMKMNWAGIWPLECPLWIWIKLGRLLYLFPTMEQIFDEYFLLHGTKKNKFVYSVYIMGNDYPGFWSCHIDRGSVRAYTNRQHYLALKLNESFSSNILTPQVANPHNLISRVHFSLRSASIRRREKCVLYGDSACGVTPHWVDKLNCWSWLQL